MTTLTMNLILILTFIMVMKRTVFGPQKIFARAGSAFTILGAIMVFASNKQDLLLPVIVLSTGLVLIATMLAVECWWIIKDVMKKLK